MRDGQNLTARATNLRVFTSLKEMAERVFGATGQDCATPVDGPNYDLRDFVVEDIDGNRLIYGSPKAAS